MSQLNPPSVLNAPLTASRATYDWVGLIAGTLCAVHCVLTPLVIAAVPLLGTGGWWGMLDVVFLLTSLLAVWMTVRTTALPAVRRGAIVAWIVLALGLMCERLGASGSDYIMYLGGAGLLVAHVVNIRHCRRCRIAPASAPYAKL